MLKVGSQVVAQNRITELGLLKRRELHVHAEPGDSGNVVFAVDDRRTVTWERTGTTSECLLSELGTSAPANPNAEQLERLAS